GIGDFYIFGNDGNDTVSADGGSGTGAFLEQEDDLLQGDDGIDTLNGTDLDTINGDSIRGGEGNDFLTGNTGRGFLEDFGLVDDMNGDSIANCLDDDERDTLNGGEGDDVMGAGDGRDVLRGGNADDVESGGDCNDVFDEGNGPNGGDILDGQDDENGSAFQCI